MKNVILSLFLSLFYCVTFSQTPIDVYVVNPNNCPYSITSTWSSPFAAGNANIISVDTLINQDVWHLEVPDSSNQAIATVCAVPSPPCNCPIECMGPISIYPNMSYTLVLCNNVNLDELDVFSIENPLVGVVFFPMTEPTTFYLINYESKIIKWGKNKITPSFDSNDLPSGVYHLILETETTKKIYKLIK